METVAKTFIENLKKAREKAGLTQAEAAESIGISLSGYAKIEYGKSWVGAEIIEKISKALKVPASSLFKVESEASDADQRLELLARILTRLPTLKDTELMAVDVLVETAFFRAPTRTVKSR